MSTLLRNCLPRVFILFALATHAGCGSAPEREFGTAQVSPSVVRFGADLSSLPACEAAGAVYRDSGAPEDPLTILEHEGVDLVRLRLWHTPPSGQCDLPATLRLARRVSAHGQDLLLDLHYSDTWADPGHQTKPVAWRELDFATLCDSVRTYSREVIAALADQGTPPALVQAGNEIGSGFLWDDGRVGGAYDTPLQWDRFATLLRAAIAGVRDGTPPGTNIRVLIHIDCGGGPDQATAFFENLVRRGVVFDAIGLSYYPWWHGSLEVLRETLSALATTYGKPLYLVETAYPWTLNWFDTTHNLVGSSDQLLPGFPATPGGQRRFLAQVMRIVCETPRDLGRGVIYWEPAWVASGRGSGSPWENLTLFDASGNLLPAAGVMAESSACPIGTPQGN